MKAFIVAPILTVLAASSAWPSESLADKKNCLGCHSVSVKQGAFPSFRDVAAKYAGQQDAVNKLATKIRSGGSGAWGVVPMPENPHVTEAEAVALAAWVLNLK